MENKDEILEHWMSRVRKEVKAAENLREVILINTAPAFIDNLAEALSQEHARSKACQSSTVAEEHGGERARLTTYGPEQLLKEYQILRDTLFEKLSSKVTLTEQERLVINKYIDIGVNQAMNSFFLRTAGFASSLSRGLAMT
ncbi:MAG: hypothetical protein HC883_05995 [Bdellovibrionaceae bacterium]|nr:hypothetical protein [Pseudobdellovibrionaceae bacterium]